MTTIKLFQKLNALDECSTIEAKTGTEVGRAALRSVCAFANEPGLGGGTILFGVARSEDLFDDRYEVCGVPDADKLQADFVSQCRAMFNRPVRPEVSVDTLDGKAVVRAYIPESEPGDKPVFFESQGLPRGAYRRIGSSDQRCTEDDLLLLYEGRRRNTFDADRVPEADFSELDSDAISDYRRERGRASPGAEELSWSNEDLLIGIGCAVKEGARTLPTVAGVLLFGSRPLLRRLFPMVRLDYIRVSGTEWIEDPERRFETIEMRDPIIRLIRRGEAAILDDLPRRFHLPPGELQRRDVPQIPDRVIREAVVNALMHRSYRTQGPTQIIRYSNRVEIRNPGHSLKAEDRLGEPGSETRNPVIAAVLHETDFAETKGSGIRVMRKLMREMDLAPPTFVSNRQADKFVATLFLHNLLDDDAREWLRSFDDLGLTTDQMRALVHVRVAGRITNAEYRGLSGVDTLEASTRLRRLRDLGLLEQHDHGAATYYTPTDQVLSEKADLSHQSNEQPHKLSEESTEFIEQPHKQNGKPHKLPEQSHKLAEKPREFDLPPELLKAVKELKGWSPQTEVRLLIQRLCGSRPMTAGELSTLLDRSRDYLRSAYLGPMIKAGELEYTNPDSPRDPGQKYRTPE